MNEIKKMYSKAASTKKEEVKYVVAKRQNAGKRATRPAGLKGHYKQVSCGSLKVKFSAI